MKKYIQIGVVLALVVAVVGLARSGPAWASAVLDSGSSGDKSLAQDARLNYDAAPTSITIKESGRYEIAGTCVIDVTYKLESGLMDMVDVDVPLVLSREVPFGYEGDLYLPGCHVVHYKDGEIVRETSAEDGSWEVCFAERPDITLTIYYYYDDPQSGSQVWIELDTWHDDGMACAYAPFTGEYAPGSEQLKGGNGERESEIVIEPPPQGSIVPPSHIIRITKSGAYGIGGICTLIVVYKEPEQSDEVHVADAILYNNDPVDGYDYATHAKFPDGEGLLYLPGCHVVHYKLEDITYWEKYKPQGEWEICFSARPDKEMTIYYYLGDYETQESAWVPLETTIKGGQACAPAYYTGVYVPTGK